MEALNVYLMEEALPFLVKPVPVLSTSCAVIYGLQIKLCRITVCSTSSVGRKQVGHSTRGGLEEAIFGAML